MIKKFIKHHADGSLWAKGFMKDGKMHGAWTWFRKEGSKMRSGRFENGKQVGIWITYDKTGRVVRKTIMI